MNYSRVSTVNISFDLDQIYLRQTYMEKDCSEKSLQLPFSSIVDPLRADIYYKTKHSLAVKNDSS